MRVILFRHGPAGHGDPARWPDDALRPLTPKGVERTRLAARGLCRMEPDLSVILTSPYLRSFDTARALSEAAEAPAPRTLDALAAGNPGRPVMAELEKLEPRLVVALVGHEPDLGLLAARMIGAARPLAIKKAGACAIEFAAAPADGRGRLLWFMPPRVLRRFGRREPRSQEHRS
jgi:phosphohistidine phosphatase